MTLSGRADLFAEEHHARAELLSGLAELLQLRRNTWVGVTSGI